MEATREPSAQRLILSLSISGLVAGIVLVGVYDVTYPAIQKNRAEAVKKAVFKIYGEHTKGFEVFLLGSDHKTLQAFDMSGGALPEGSTVFGAVDSSGQLMGYAVPAEGAGFQDTIKILYGYDPTQKRIVGMEVLESKETPGLGDKIGSDAKFRANFTALSVEPAIQLVKGKKSGANEVDAISGATISSDAVVKILNRSLDQWRPILAAEAAKKSGAKER
ncbi:MAG: FMN-binding protein [Candidatus Schekmanbacteria bacterium]|nr:FMN-binding protein [Candidatus Schekmanbacteria bacterium]